MILKLGYQGQGLLCLHKCDPGLTLTYFTARSKLLLVIIPHQKSGERLQDHWSSGYCHSQTENQTVFV